MVLEEHWPGVWAQERGQSSCPKASKRPTADPQAQFPWKSAPGTLFPPPIWLRAREQARWRGYFHPHLPMVSPARARCLCGVTFLCAQAHSLQPQEGTCSCPQRRVGAGQGNAVGAGEKSWVGRRTGPGGVTAPSSCTSERLPGPALPPSSRGRLLEPATSFSSSKPVTISTHSRVCGGGGFSQTCT